MSENMWNKTHNLRVVDGYIIEIQWMSVGLKASQALFKATTWHNFRDNPAPEPMVYTRFGASLTEAIANLLNDIQPMEAILKPCKPISEL